MNYNYILFLESYFGETLLKKVSKITVPKKMTFFFFGIILWWSTFEKGFENYSSEKKELYFFWNCFLVKHFFEKGFQNYSSKKNEL